MCTRPSRRLLVSSLVFYVEVDLSVFFFRQRVLFVVCCFAGSLISAPDGCLLTDEHSRGGPVDSASSHFIFRKSGHHFTSPFLAARCSVSELPEEYRLDYWEMTS